MNRKNFPFSFFVFLIIKQNGKILLNLKMCFTFQDKLLLFQDIVYQISFNIFSYFKINVMLWPEL